MGQWTEPIADSLERFADVLEDAGLWYTLMYGTLLGAVRDGAVIDWDYDFDLTMRPEDVPHLFALSDRLAKVGLSVAECHLERPRLPVNPGLVNDSYIQSIDVYVDGVKYGDIYVFQAFSDGIVRRFDRRENVYWWPHSSFPAWFLEGRETTTLRGRTYPTPRAPEQLLAGIYGDDWRTPYKAPIQGGEYRDGGSYHGDLYAPKIDREIEWCLARGWDRSKYVNEVPWPQVVRGGGPYGWTERSKDTTQTYWWRSITELIRYY